MTQFKNWHEIQDWFKAHGYHDMVKRMQLNNDCWDSCGEFGRDQVMICDSMRFAESEEERERVAEELAGNPTELQELGII